MKEKLLDSFGERKSEDEDDVGSSPGAVAPVVSADRHQTLGEHGADAVIPDWVRNNAGWWADDQIDDRTFANGIEFLINVGIIVV